MEDVFVIAVKCPHCKKEDLIRDPEDDTSPVQFADAEEAHVYASRLKLKQARVYGERSSMTASVDKRQTMHVCPHCGTVSPVRDLTPRILPLSVLLQQAKDEQVVTNDLRSGSP